jgi:ppGpp synthetase/RelA/SpoT-type nucleotidyltranferase
MVSESELQTYYATLVPTYDRVLSDLLWQLDQTFKQAGAAETSRTYTSSRLLHRVKTFDSTLRKCRREGVARVEDVPSSVEDILGIRLIAPNKAQARELYDFFQARLAEWFCEVSEPPKPVPYTIEDRNNYALKSGYQAFHITFIHHRSYAPITEVELWPVEVQIMSELWAFWADYSRRYFYIREEPWADSLLPYNVAIARILDAADDLMVTTSEFLELSEKGEAASPESIAGLETPGAGGLETPGVSIDDVRAWLTDHGTRLFGDRVRIPNELFLWRIAEDLNLYRISFPELEEFFARPAIVDVYRRTLGASRLDYLPPYQQIKLVVLLGLGWDVDAAVARVNEELVPQGVRLECPSEER